MAKLMKMKLNQELGHLLTSYKRNMCKNLIVPSLI